MSKKYRNISWDNRDYRETAKKAERILTDSELLNEIDRAGSDAAHYAYLFRSNKRIQFLEEMKYSISIVQALIDELEYRYREV